MTLFEKLLNQKREDFSTEILAYLLSDEHENKDFVTRFLAEITGLKMSDKFKFVTQRSTCKGKPDLIGLSKNYTLIIENKLDSGLSDYDQLIKYGDAFECAEVIELRRKESLQRESNNMLILLAPIVRKEQALRMTKEELGISDLDKYFIEKKVEFKSTGWETLCDRIINDSFVIEKELRRFVESSLSTILSLDEYETISENLNTSESLAKKIQNTLNIFVENLMSAGIAAGNHLGPKKEDLWIELRIPNTSPNKSWAYFGYFNSAVRKLGSNHRFSLELKKDQSIEGWNHAENIRKLEEFGRYVPAPVNDYDAFIPFDYKDYLSWKDQIEKIMEVLGVKKKNICDNEA